MKKLTYLIVLLFSISSLPAFSANPPSSGAACAKLGVTQSYQGKKYTCIKSGKKLIWNKGVIIEKTSQNSNQPPVTPKTTSDSSEPLLETPCTTKDEEKTASFLLVCFQDRTRGLIWIRKGTDVLYNFLGTPTSLRNNSDIWTPRSAATFKQSKNPLVTLPNFSSNPVSPSSIDACKLVDLHDKKLSPDGPMAHGFPVEPMNPKYYKEGVLKVGILPVDFTDAPGEATLKEDLKRNIAIFQDWFKYYSGGKLKIEVTTSDNWVHSNKDSSAFDWKLSYPNLLWLDMAQKIGQSYIDLAPANFNFSELGALIIYMPQRDNKINVDLTLQSLEYSTPQGKQYVAVHAPPILLYKRGQESWAFWVHELLHGIGIAGHAPGGNQGLPLGIMDTQMLGSRSLNVWEQFILGWLPESQSYCIAPEKIAGQIVPLSPMEREDLSTKGVFIPLTDHSGLVIQSNRDDKWSSKQKTYTFPDNYAGVVVYLVDTRFGNWRVKGYGVDTPEHWGALPKDLKPEELFYANYVRIDGEPTRQFGCPVGLATPPGLENTKGGACWQWTVLNYAVGAVGDTYTISGITIQVVGSSKYDYVKITRKV